MKLKIFLLVVLFGWCERVSSKGFYTIISSQVIKLNEKFPVLVTAQGYEKPTEFQISIKGHSDGDVKYENIQNVTFKNDRTQQIVFDLSKQELGSYYLEAKSLSDNLTQYSVNLHMATKKYSVFIQTDKAMYKPGDKVQFRVLVLDSETRPFKSQKIEIFIYDGGNNRIKQYEKIMFRKGVYKNELQLADEPVLGFWSIHVKVNGGDDTLKSFEVAEYILPKFEVLLTAKRDLKVDEMITVSCVAKYTYGKAMRKGKIAVRAESADFWWSEQGVKKVTKTQDLNGIKNVFEFDAKNELNLTEIWWQREVLLTATVTDELTGRSQNASTTVIIHKDAFAIEFSGSFQAFKPDIPFTVVAVAKDLEGAPITDSKNPFAMNITYTYDTWEDEDPNATTTAAPIWWWRPIPYKTKIEVVTRFFANGTTSLTLSAPENVTSIAISAEYQGTSAYYWTNSRPTESKQYIDVMITTKSLSIKQAVDVTVVGTTKLSQITYVVTSSGALMLASTLFAPNTKTFKFKFLPTFDMVPSAKLLVFYITKDGEIISDSADLEFGDDLKNFVDLKVAEEAKPGNILNITVKSLPKSYVGLLGIDQSVLLLKSGNDIDKSMVSAELQQYSYIDKYNFEWKEDSYYGSYTDLWMTNLMIITNAKQEYQRAYRSYPFAPPMVVDKEGEGGSGGPAASTAFINTGAGPPQPLEPRGAPVTVRKEFPETWLFDCIDNINGIKNITRRVPDTITSWVITGFSLDAQNGLGLTKQPSKLTVFQPFFVSLNLPYSIKRGEVVAIQAVVFNYLKTDKTAAVTFFNNLNEFEFISAKTGSKPSKDKKKSLKIEIPSESGVTVSFLVRPLIAGHVTIRVEATTDVAGDAIENQLIVEPEGVTQYMNKAVFVDLRKNSEFKTTIAIAIPPKVVPGSVKVEASAIGDILGPSIENLNNLIQLPSGCGEQNMLGFVPNIVALDYLTALNQLTPEIELKAKTFMEIGCQNEMNYKHDDWSYSAFGKSDASGSTWLTAFVARSFNQASKYISINQELIKPSLDFLAKTQAPNGSFPEVGRVIHTAMQGGSSNGVALTAYTLITFVENQNLSTSYQKTIDDALDFVIKNVDFIDDVYTLAIATYALQILQHKSKDLFMAKLDDKAIRKDGLTHWERAASKEELNDPWNFQPSSINAEMTAYALLAYIEAGRDTDAIPIMRWLITQRNANGGFQSTQDTVVGLQALSKLAVKIHGGTNNINIVLSYENGKKTTIELNNANALVLQKFDLPSTQSIDVVATGQGFSILQISYKYNLNSIAPSPRFILDPKVNSGPDKHVLSVTVCASFIPDDTSDKSSMAVMEVEFPSGFTFDSDSLATLKETEKVKRVETKKGDTVVVIYFDDMSSKPICPEVFAFRSHGVADQKPASILIYDYYDNTRRATTFYSPPALSLCDICDKDACDPSCK